LAKDDFVADGDELVEERAEDVLVGKGVDAGSDIEDFAEVAARLCASSCFNF
jgi:hypothetical protein